MLAAVIAEEKFEDAVNSLRKAKDADLIELRLDYIKNLDDKKLKILIKKCMKPAIATARKKGEGGLFIGNEAKRIEILKNSIKFGADYIDIESSSNKGSIKNLIQNKKNAKVIVSYHNFKETPDNVKDPYSNIKNLEPDLIKIVTRANSVVDNFKIFDLLKTANKEKKNIVAFCMGPFGQFSRILSLIFGSEITYAFVDKGKGSASGQLALNELASCYRLKKINKNTKIAGLIGNPVEHSWSHIIHNLGFDKLDINAVYLKFKVDMLKEFVDYFRKINVLGFSVTIPHKIEIVKYLDEIDIKAQEIGAVNTIVVKNKKLIGYNTDSDGAIHALKRKMVLKGKNIVLLGAGGSTRALAYGLKAEKVNISILNRTVEKAKNLAEHFNCDYGSLKDLKNIDYDILINTTSVGMYPEINSSLVPKDLIKKNSVVFDIVFNPFKTKLLKEAENKGCTIIPGFEMLIYGAMLQFKLWTDKNAPEKAMRKKIMEHLKNAGNKN